MFARCYLLLFHLYGCVIRTQIHKTKGKKEYFISERTNTKKHFDPPYDIPRVYKTPQHNQLERKLNITRVST